MTDNSKFIILLIAITCVVGMLFFLFSNSDKKKASILHLPSNDSTIKKNTLKPKEDTSICEYKINEGVAAKGLQILYHVPCIYSPDTIQESQPNVASAFIHKIGEAEVSIILMIEEMPRAATKSELKSHFENSSVKKLAKSIGAVDSSKAITFAGLPGAAYFFEKRQDEKIYVYSARFQTFFLDKNITFNLFVADKSELMCATLYKTEFPLFQKAASRFLILNEWK